MNNVNNNQARMISTSVSYCVEKASVTSGIPQFVIVIGNVSAKMVLIDSLNPIASGTSRGVTMDVNLIRMAMVKLGFKCASGALAYANSIQNNTLKELVNYTEAKLNRLTKEMVDDICESIMEAANTHIGQVTNFGVVATDISDLGVAIGLYRASDDNSRNTIITRSLAKKQVTKLIREVIDDLLVGQLDKMVNTLKESNEDFYDGYYQARMIIDLGTSSTMVRGTVKDVGDVPLIGVQFRVLVAGTETEVKKVYSEVKGVYRAAKLPVGIFDLEWSFAGYNTVKEVNVKLTAGKDLRRNIVMVASVVTEIVVEGIFGINEVVNIVLPVGVNDDTLAEMEVFDTQAAFFASNSANGDVTGTGTLYANDGVPVPMKWNQIVAQIGLNGAHSFFNVKNVGGGSGSWRVKFIIS